ncbi:MAG: hypothetical protein KGD58_02205 [Candidatus Lokiarchaeota archaeon]|nr:hypothetical protein [Candidatus Lokiarchaeota archaeon]
MHNEITDMNIKNHIKPSNNVNHQDRQKELRHNPGTIKKDFISSIRQWEYRKKIEKFKGNLRKLR